MFLFFHLNKKLGEEKGQLVPVFIVVIVMLIIMAMVTVNLSKQALVKTDVANAADAGALAGGSMMAGVFNQQAVLNSQMKVSYEAFYASAAVSVAVMMASMLAAQVACCTWVGAGAASALYIGVKFGAYGLMVATFGFGVKQVFFQKHMKRLARQGRRDALKNAYRYAYYNSGIGQRLISKSPLRETHGLRGSLTNYVDTFNTFTRTALVESPVYLWTDGQGRLHMVNVFAHTQNIGVYKMKVTAAPLINELDFLLTAAQGAAGALVTSAACYIPIVHIAACTSEKFFTKFVSGFLALYLAGLAPAYTMPDTGTGMAFLYAWVSDIEHDRRVYTMTLQKHEGEDYGIWRMRYSPVFSFSMVNFRGNGSIDPEVPRHDASIIAAF